MKDKIVLNIFIAIGLFLLGFIFYYLLIPLRSENLNGKEVVGLLIILIKIMSFFFLVNAFYGLVSGRVFGRSWTKYLGGWVYRDKEPFYYWSYVIGYFIAGIVLLLACQRVLI